MALSRALQLATTGTINPSSLDQNSVALKKMGEPASLQTTVLLIRGRELSKYVKDLLQLPRQKLEDLVNFAHFLSLVNEDLLGVYMGYIRCFGFFPFFFSTTIFRWQWTIFVQLEVASLQSKPTSRESAVEALQRKIMDCQIIRFVFVTLSLASQECRLPGEL